MVCVGVVCDLLAYEICSGDGVGDARGVDVHVDVYSAFPAVFLGFPGTGCAL